MRTNTALKYRWQCIEGGEWWYDGAQVRNPATGETVEVRDDGDGWIAPPGFLHPGTIYHFRSAWRYYVLSKLFYTPYELTIEAEDAYTGKTAITRLTHAFAISGDVRYAHKAAIMLNRLAEVYRFYTGTVDEQRPLTRGYLVQVSFEEWPIHNCLVAYDVLMDVMLQDRELLDFFARKGDCDYNGDGKVDFADVRYNIQHNLFGYMYEWLHRAMAIQTGDYVLREGLVLAAMGAILDNRELIDEAMDGPFGLATNLTNNMFRDGKWWYDSPGYAVSSVTSLIMERLFSLRHLRLVDDPRLRIGQAVGFVRGVDCDGRLPAIGDTGGADSRTKVLNPYSMCALEETAYTHTGERGCLDRLLALSGGDVDLMRDRYASVELLFYAEPIRGEAGALENGTVLFHDSGFAILRTGTELDTRKHIVLNYGKGNSGHGHHDKLAVNLIAYGYDLAADLGYPTTFTHRKVAGWETHTASHATVCIDGRNQELATGSLRLFGKTPGTQVICATGERAYPDLAEVYERTLSVIDVSDSQAYVFDVFRVRGGNVHDYLFRSLSGEAGSNFCVDHPEGVEIVPQAVGTLAGEAVAFGEMPGYGFVKDVTRATCEGVSNATWRIGNEDDTGIRLTMLGGKGMQIITGKGEGYGFFGKSPWDACFAARAVSVGETTVFTAILQPFQLRPFIKAVQPISVAGGVGAKIVLEGREDYLFRKVGNVPFCISDIDGKRVELDGEFARVSIWPRGKRELHLIQGRRLRFGDAVLEAPAIPRARIESVDPAAKTIVIVLDSGESVSDGDTIIVTNPASICTSIFEVRNADPVGERRYRLEVSMGLTLCEGVVSVVDRNEGTFQTEASLTKLKACPGLFDGKAVWVNGTRLGVVLSAAPPVFKMTDRSAVSNMVVGDSFLVSDLDTGDELEVMRSAHKTIVVADSEDLRQG
jgi:hypothetical protein